MGQFFGGLLRISELYRMRARTIKIHGFYNLHPFFEGQNRFKVIFFNNSVFM